MAATETELAPAYLPSCCRSWLGLWLAGRKQLSGGHWLPKVGPLLCGKDGRGCRGDQQQEEARERRLAETGLTRTCVFSPPPLIPHSLSLCLPHTSASPSLFNPLWVFSPLCHLPQSPRRKSDLQCWTGSWSSWKMGTAVMTTSKLFSCEHLPWAAT